jgi:hypothetical protein
MPIGIPTRHCPARDECHVYAAPQAGRPHKKRRTQTLSATKAKKRVYVRLPHAGAMPSAVEAPCNQRHHEYTPRGELARVAGQSCLAGPSVCSTVLPFCLPCSYHLLLQNVSNDTGAYSPCLLQGSACVCRLYPVSAPAREDRLSCGALRGHRPGKSLDRAIVRRPSGACKHFLFFYSRFPPCLQLTNIADQENPI